MFTRRDVWVGALAACLTLAAVALAQSPGAGVMPSATFDWTEIEVRTTATGERREFFAGKTATMDRLTCHVTTLKAGEAPHPPHQHPEEELIIVKEGTLEAMQKGRTTKLGPGSVIFEASNDLHGLRNVGATPASYFVIKFWPPGTYQETDN
jgi:XRE family transcriptional regulator, regulator of sulfur utilization